MKKLNYITILGLATGLAFAWNAAANSNNGIQEGSTGDEGNWLWGGSINAKDNKGSIHNAFMALEDQSVLSFSIERNRTDNGFTFGTYTYDANHNPQLVTANADGTLSGQIGSVAAGSTEITLLDGKTDAISDVFKANDIVGIWVKDNGTGELYYSDYKLPYNDVKSYVDGEGKTIENSQIGQNTNAGERMTDTLMFDPKSEFTSMYFHFNDAWVGSDKFPGLDYWQWDANGDLYPYANGQVSDIKISIKGVYAASAGGDEPVTPASGGPLPGVWATIALAGAASAYLKRRRKENK